MCTLKTGVGVAGMRLTARGVSAVVPTLTATRPWPWVPGVAASLRDAPLPDSWLATNVGSSQPMFLRKAELAHGLAGAADRDPGVRAAPGVISGWANWDQIDVGGVEVPHLAGDPLRRPAPPSVPPSAGWSSVGDLRDAVAAKLEREQRVALGVGALAGHVEALGRG